jgi:hypothetical protein
MHKDTKKTLLDWREEATQSLAEGLRQLFESSSEVLLEFADAAENNRLQRLFFDAQREFYLKEEMVVAEFGRGLHEQLLQFLDAAQQASRPGAETLSLVDVEDYERSLALETIAKRVLNRQLNELHALAQRLSAALGGRPLQLEQVPANPMQLIRIFDPVSRKMELEKEVRLVFYTLFDRYVMSRLGDLYANLNTRLVDMGILPNIAYTYRRYGPSAPAAGQAEDGVAQEPGADAAGAGATAAGSAGAVPRLRPSTPTATETLSAISSLLMAKRQHEPGSATEYDDLHITPSAADVGAAIADVRVLQEAPHPLPLHGAAGVPKVAIDANLLLKVKKALEKQRLIIKGLVGREHLERHEEDVIDIVGMLFEAMLNEKLLPNSVKTLLSHLHTRYLKIAVQSDDFLENTAHPARRLFERMLDAGIRWVREDNLRAGIYPQLQAIVTEILKTENLDEDFFNAKIAELDGFEQRLEKQSLAAEERTLEAERGRARLEQAKALVHQMIDEISRGSDLPAAVTSFLSTTYADYLTLLLLRSDLDTGSPAWANASNLGEALVAAAAHAAAGRPLGHAQCADLGQRLESSVCGLIPHHEQNIRRVIAALEKPMATAAPEPAREQPQPAPVRVLHKPAASTPAAPAAPPARVDEADRRVADKLMRSAGEWFVMQAPDGDAEQSVKLLWVNPHTRNMLFVDQHGAKVALLPADEVAQRVRAGGMRPMQQDSSSFVARSLRRIRRALEDSVNA